MVSLAIIRVICGWYQVFFTCMIHTRRTLYEAKQGCGVVSCTNLVAGVRADPKYSYSYDIICLYDT